MSKMDKFEDKVMPVADKIANNRYLCAIRDGFMLAMPLLIIGAMFLLFSALPIPGYENFMAGIFGANWADFFLVPYHATMAIMTLFVVLGISNSLSEHYEQDGISTAVIALVCFFVLTPFTTNFTPKGSSAIYKVDSVIPMEWIGSKGLFVGMLTAIFATEIVKSVYKKGWKITMPKGVPPAVSKAFSALIPGAIAISVFGIVRLIFCYTPFHTVHNLIFTILQVPLTSLGDSLGATIIANFFVSLFWLFGISGADVVEAVMNPIWLALSADNLAAYSKGVALPHVVTQQFVQIYTWVGGSGCTLALCIALLTVCKSQQCKKIGQLGILPGLFNINEPVTFGLPIVLNPILAIPFIATPIVESIITYVCMAGGIVPAPNGVIIPWTTPVIIGGLFVSGWQGAVLQAIELVIAFLIYLPFIKIVDRQYCEQEKTANQAEGAQENA